jgi:hypothetical protein
MGILSKAERPAMRGCKELFYTLKWGEAVPGSTGFELDGRADFIDSRSNSAIA